LCQGNDLSFVNKQRSFKIDFSEGKHFEKLVLHPHKANNNKGKKGDKPVMEDSFPSSSQRDHTPHLAIPGPSRAFFPSSTLFDKDSG